MPCAAFGFASGSASLIVKNQMRDGLPGRTGALWMFGLQAHQRDARFNA
jgi:hypothetical protein